VTSPAPTQPELEARVERWAECTFKKVREFDDGRSDAATVAVPVHAACQGFYQGTAEGSMRLTIGAVLKVRAYDTQVKQAITPEWRDCVLGEMRGRDVMTGQVTMIATIVAARCRHVFNGPEGSDVNIVAFAVGKVRSQPSDGVEPFVVSPPQPLPPMDKRF
jgi:hypothetical protein